MLDDRSISDAQLTALKTLRESRPQDIPAHWDMIASGMVLVAGVPALVFIGIFFALGPSKALILPMLLSVGVTALALFWGSGSGARRKATLKSSWAQWQARVQAVDDGQGDYPLRVTLPHEADGPTLIYRTSSKESYDCEALWLLPAQAVDVSLMTLWGNQEPTLLPPPLHYIFNLGRPWRCQTPRAVPLLGAQIRLHLDDWFDGAAWINAGTVEMKLGQQWIDPQQPQLERIWAGAALLFERLTGPMTDALRALALDTAHPFDAARALAALAVQAPAVADEVRQALSDDPLSAAWAQLACTGEGLMTVPDDLRCEVGRGVMGIVGPARDAIIEQLQTVAIEGTDLALLALAQLIDMAFLLTQDPAFQARTAAMVQVMGAQGGAGCLRWLDERGSRLYDGGAAKAASDAVKARLLAGMGGALSVQPPKLAGGLSTSPEVGGPAPLDH